jgi:hypothetical protein
MIYRRTQIQMHTPRNGTRYFISDYAKTNSEYLFVPKVYNFRLCKPPLRQFTQNNLKTLTVYTGCISTEKNEATVSAQEIRYFY